MTLPVPAPRLPTLGPSRPLAAPPRRSLWCARPPRQSLGTRAFTLIELMIVVGVIVLLLGGFGFALRDNAGSALTSAQNSLGALVGQARAQAAVNQTEARLAVFAVRPPAGELEKYLRLLQVFIASPQGSNTWVPVGSPVYLPRGVYFVPPTTTGLLATGVTWPTNPAPISNAASGTLPGQPTGTPFFGATAIFYVEFKADGSLNPPANPYIKLVLTTGGGGANNLPAFNNPSAVRGLLLRPSGAIAYVNEANGF